MSALFRTRGPALTVLLILLSPLCVAQAAGDGQTSPWVVLGGVLGVLTFVITIGTLVWRLNSQIATAKQEAIAESSKQVEKSMASMVSTIQQSVSGIEQRMTTTIEHQVAMLKQQAASDRELLMHQLGTFRLEVREDVRGQVETEIVRCPHHPAHLFTTARG